MERDRKRWDFMGRKVALYAAICGRGLSGFVCSVIRVRALRPSPLSHNGKSPFSTVSHHWTGKYEMIKFISINYFTSQTHYVSDFLNPLSKIDLSQTTIMEVHIPYLPFKSVAERMKVTFVVIL